MKVGSLVECVETFPPHPEVCFPKVGRIYTIRGMEEHFGYQFVCLEEIINKKVWIDNRMEEPIFDARAFRELEPLPNISIEEILKETV